MFKIITETNGFSTRGRCTVDRAGLYDSFSVGPNGRFRDSLRGTRPAVLFSHVSLHVPRSEVSACTRHLPPTYTPDGLGPAATYAVESGARLRATTVTLSPSSPGRSDAKINSKIFQKRSVPPGDVTRKHLRLFSCFDVVWRPLWQRSSIVRRLYPTGFRFRSRVPYNEIFRCTIIYSFDRVPLHEHRSFSWQTAKAFHNPVFESILPVSPHRFLCN